VAPGISKEDDVLVFNGQAVQDWVYLQYLYGLFPLSLCNTPQHSLRNFCPLQVYIFLKKKAVVSQMYHVI